MIVQNSTFLQSPASGIDCQMKKPALPSQFTFTDRYQRAGQCVPYQRVVNFVTFDNNPDSVDESVGREYLTGQARPGREARLSQQPRHPPFYLPPAAFTKPADISGIKLIQRNYLCI